MLTWLIEHGYEVYSPVVNWHHYNLFEPHHYEWYMARCLEMVPRCDVLVRMPGVSPGSDRECALARENGIPVLHGREGVCSFDEAAL